MLNAVNKNSFFGQRITFSIRCVADWRRIKKFSLLHKRVNTNVKLCVCKITDEVLRFKVVFVRFLRRFKPLIIRYGKGEQRLAVEKRYQTII